MSYPKHHRGKGRGGNRSRNNYRPGSSPPPQSFNQFANNLEDGFSNTDIYLNKAIVYYVTSNLGEVARVVIRNGDIYEGILKAVSPKFDCTLGEAHLIQKRKANGLIEDERIVPSRDSLISNLLIALKDIVSVNITRMEEPSIASAIDSFTDEAITSSKHTNGQLMDRPLKKWVPQDVELHLGGGLEDDVRMNGWSADDMFKTNQEKFGVTSTYNDDLLQYTTPLPKDSTREMELRAEQTAREIEQSKGHTRRQEVDSGRSEEEAFAAVIRTQTTAQASRPTASPSPPVIHVSVTDRQEVAPNTNTSTPTTTLEITSTTTSVSSTTDDRGTPETKTTASEEASGVTSVKDPAASEAPKSQHEVIKGDSSSGSCSSYTHDIRDLKDFHVNFKLSQKPTKKVSKDVQPESETVETAVTPSNETPPAEAVKNEDDKTTKSTEESILLISKLNPLAKEFKFTPKAQVQKSVPSPQPPQYVPMVAQPFSPTSIRAPAIPGAPFSQPMMMVSPQQFSMFNRGKQPFNKPRSQQYGGREQGESSQYISAATAAGSPIIAPGGTFPQPVYQIPPQVAYVPSPAGIVPQPMVPQYVTVPAGHGHPRFITPVSSPAGGASVPMSQTYQDGSHVPVYVTNNMSAMQSTSTPPGQPQPSPSQQGQFIFTGPVPQMPGQPQPPGPHQGQVTPGPAQFTPGVLYMPNPNVPTSAASAPVYIPGTFPGDRMQ